MQREFDKSGGILSLNKHASLSEQKRIQNFHTPSPNFGVLDQCRFPVEISSYATEQTKVNNEHDILQGHSIVRFRSWCCFT